MRTETRDLNCRLTDAESEDRRKQLVEADDAVHVFDLTPPEPDPAELRRMRRMRPPRPTKPAAPPKKPGGS